MKHLFFLYILGLLLCYGCEHTELKGYEGGSSVYFSKKSFQILGDTMRYDTWGVIDGDVKEQVFKLPIYLFGTVTDYDRTIKIRTVLCEVDSLRAEANVDFRPIPTEVVLPANSNETYVEIIMLRSEELQKHNRIFTVVIEENDQFDSEYNWRKDNNGNSYFLGHSMTIIISENFPRPWWWRDESTSTGFQYFGKHSYLKADLICTLCNISRTEFIDKTVIPESKLKYYGKKVQRWLDAQETPYLEEDGTPMVMGEKSQE